MNFFQIAILSISMLLAACGNPLDTKLVKDQGNEAYHASLKAFTDKADPEDVAAYDYFAEDYTVDQLNKMAHIQTPRDLIVWGSEQVLKEMNDEHRMRVKTLAENHEKIAKGLYAIETSFEIKKEFFGLMPYISAKYVNQSGLSLSSTEWIAEIYIDGNKEPSASYVYLTNFSQGLDSGYEIKDRRLMGHIKGDPAWTTPAIQRSKNIEIKVKPFIGSQKGLDLQYLTGTEEQIKTLTGLEENAKKFLAKYK